MFLEKLIPKKYHAKQEVCALEVLYKEDGVNYYCTILKNKGKRLEIVEKSMMEDRIDLPKLVLKSKIPLVLVINGKGVIVKKINVLQGEQSLETIIEQNLPAINKDELFIQVFKQTDQTAFLALCRKEIVNSVISELKKNKYEVANVLIGTPAILGMQPLWNNFNRIPTSIQAVELNNACVDSIQGNIEQNEMIKIEDLILEKDHTLGFASGLSYLMQNRISENMNEEMDGIGIAHVERNKLRVLTLGAVAIAFVVAIINVLFYTSYFDKNNKLETELSVYQGKYDQINKLLNDYQGKKDLIEGAGILNKNKLSEYADKVGASIPEEVILSHMHFNPKKNDEESADSLVNFENKQLIIRGNCNKSLVVNEWLNVLKMQNFVRDVSLEKFSYNKESALPNFEIKIVTK